MAFSIQREVSDGTLVLLDISISYIDRDEISVLFDGVVQVEGDTWDWVGTGDTKLSFTPAVGNGVEIAVVRQTDLSDLRHRFSEGAAFTANSMDEALEQVLHIAQESAEQLQGTDFYNDLDMHGYAVKNVAAGTLSGDAVNYSQLAAHDAVIIGYRDTTLGFRDEAEAFAIAAEVSASAAVSAFTLAVPRTSPTGAAGIPAGTTAERPIAPTVGMLRFNTSLGQLEQYTGLVWRVLPDELAAVSITGVQTLSNKTLLADTNLLEATSAPGGTPFASRNKIINGGFNINQRGYTTGNPVGAGLYGHDRWKMASSGDTYTFTTTANKVVVTIPSTKVLRQVIEGLNLQSGTYTLTWDGTAQGKIGAGSYGASGLTATITGGMDTTIEFRQGTVSNVQFEIGDTPTPFEQRPIGLELALCQRYYEVGRASGRLGSTSATTLGYPIGFKVPMRSSPIIAFGTPVSTFGLSSGPFADNPDTFGFTLRLSGASDYGWVGPFTASAEL